MAYFFQSSFVNCPSSICFASQALAVHAVPFIRNPIDRTLFGKLWLESVWAFLVIDRGEMPASLPQDVLDRMDALLSSPMKPRNVNVESLIWQGHKAVHELLREATSDPGNPLILAQRILLRIVRLLITPGKGLHVKIGIIFTFLLRDIGQVSLRLAHHGQTQLAVELTAAVYRLLKIRGEQYVIGDNLVQLLTHELALFRVCMERMPPDRPSAARIVERMKAIRDASPIVKENLELSIDIDLAEVALRHPAVLHAESAFPNLGNVKMPTPIERKRREFKKLKQQAKTKQRHDLHMPESPGFSEEKPLESRAGSADLYLDNAEDAIPPPPGTSLATSQPPSGISKKILLVDEDATRRTQLRDVLSAWKYGTAEAGNAQEAIDWLRLNSADLVLTQYTMSPISGPALIEKMKDLGISTPVLLLSSIPENMLKTTPASLDAAYVNQQHGVTVIRQKVQKLLEDSPREPGAPAAGLQVRQRKTSVIVTPGSGFYPGRSLNLSEAGDDSGDQSLSQAAYERILALARAGRMFKEVSRTDVARLMDFSLHHHGELGPLMTLRGTPNFSGPYVFRKNDQSDRSLFEFEFVPQMDVLTSIETIVSWRTGSLQVAPGQAGATQFLGSFWLSAIKDVLPWTVSEHGNTADSFVRLEIRHEGLDRLAELDEAGSDETTVVVDGRIRDPILGQSAITSESLHKAKPQAREREVESRAHEILILQAGGQAVQRAYQPLARISRIAGDICEVANAWANKTVATGEQLRASIHQALEHADQLRNAQMLDLHPVYGLINRQRQLSPFSNASSSEREDDSPAIRELINTMESAISVPFSRDDIGSLGWYKIMDGLIEAAVKSEGWDDVAASLKKLFPPGEENTAPYTWKAVVNATLEKYKKGSATFSTEELFLRIENALDKADQYKESAIVAVHLWSDLVDMLEQYPQEGAQFLMERHFLNLLSANDVKPKDILLDFDSVAAKAIIVRSVSESYYSAMEGENVIQCVNLVKDQYVWLKADAFSNKRIWLLSRGTQASSSAGFGLLPLLAITPLWGTGLLFAFAREHSILVTINEAIKAHQHSMHLATPFFWALLAMIASGAAGALWKFWIIWMDSRGIKTTPSAGRQENLPQTTWPIEVPYAPFDYVRISRAEGLHLIAQFMAHQTFSSLRVSHGWSELGKEVGPYIQLKQDQGTIMTWNSESHQWVAFDSVLSVDYAFVVNPQTKLLNLVPFSGDGPDDFREKIMNLTLVPKTDLLDPAADRTGWIRRMSNHQAPGYDRVWGREAQRELAIHRFELLDDLDHRGIDGPILDPGTATGRDAASIIAQGRIALGLDLSEERLRLAQTNHPHLPLVQMDIQRLGLRSGSMAAIWDSGTFHELAFERMGEVLNSYRALLKPGGELFLRVLKRIPQDPPYNASFWPTMNTFDEAVLRKLVEDSGFEILRIGTEPSTPTSQFKQTEDREWIYLFATPATPSAKTSSVSLHSPGWVELAMLALFTLPDLASDHPYLMWALILFGIQVALYHAFNLVSKQLNYKIAGDSINWKSAGALGAIQLAIMVLTSLTGHGFNLTHLTSSWAGILVAALLIQVWPFGAWPRLSAATGLKTLSVLCGIAGAATFATMTLGRASLNWSVFLGGATLSVVGLGYRILIKFSRTRSFGRPIWLAREIKNGHLDIGLILMILGVALAASQWDKLFHQQDTPFLIVRYFAGMAMAVMTLGFDIVSSYYGDEMSGRKKINPPIRQFTRAGLYGGWLMAAVGSIASLTASIAYATPQPLDLTFQLLLTAMGMTAIVQLILPRQDVLPGSRALRWAIAAVLAAGLVVWWGIPWNPLASLRAQNYLSQAA